jgi:hypothetical protein
MRDARQKAGALVDRLLREQAEIETNSPSIPADALERGRAAMSRAVDAARRTLAAIDAALAQDDSRTELN